jgi:GNAT superfamily N-acetyltransferase
LADRLPDWRFAPATEADFEPLLEIRVEVMREHLERVFRYSPERARQFFRDSFDQPGLRLILVEGERAGCVAFRVAEKDILIDSFYLARRLHNGGLGTAILDALLAEADALGLPVKLGVLHGSPANRFYERRGFRKVSEDEIEGYYERPVCARGS